ncbi:MAG: hypothetical protein AABN95_16200 [Acidobacteriota bacterium]
MSAEHEHDGCGYQGYEFGAGSYPDSICLDGQLFDAADDCDDEGRLYVPLEEIPCPMCRPADAVDYWADRNQRGGGSAKAARKAARALINNIRRNRERGTEPWKQAS